MNKPLVCIILSILLGNACLWGQEPVPAREDTLKASRIVTDRFVVLPSGTRAIPLQQIKSSVSPTGEYDVIKYIQTLPGVSTGAEGSSAIYARGGNVGNNLTTLDGVPIYGASHLLGLTSVYSPDILSSATFRMSGFQVSDNNLTSSHIDLRSSDGDFSDKAVSTSISNFIIGSSFSGPIIQDKVSFIGSIRVSPIGPEYNLMQSVVGGPLDSLQKVRATVFDMYGKATYRINPCQRVSLSIFGSNDSYRYSQGNGDHRMGWSNFIVHASHAWEMNSGWVSKGNISFNRYKNGQGVMQQMSGTLNDLAIISSLSELSSDILLSRQIRQQTLVQAGTSVRTAWFNPGSTAEYEGLGAFTPQSSTRTDNRSFNVISSLYGQIDLGNEMSWYHVMASVKSNVLILHSDPDKKARTHVYPEGSILVSVKPFRWISFEGSADWSTQYYHTLEGIPLGWSLDILIPSDSKRKAESSGQLYGGLALNLGHHQFSIGAFKKQMKGLVYFKDASQLFSSSIAGWDGNIDVGEGSSQGLEMLYNKSGDKVTWQVSYTLSKADRLFPTVNRGLRFPAKFDRRHILNASFSGEMLKVNKIKVSLTSNFTFQSGHHETVACGEFDIIPPFGGEWFSLDYYSGTNNYQMPDYIRLDSGLTFDIDSKHKQSLSIGIYNMLNRHNIFTVTYDSGKNEWQKISLFPIMPSLHYSIEF
ncbi:MAG: TonB-dependent receptor plug domain-containing protein [Bacteroidales bacterium]|nr:TonB-dependent receptor plug domain-containing protein [Bacteroidales bacterium]